MAQQEHHRAAPPLVPEGLRWLEAEVAEYRRAILGGPFFREMKDFSCPQDFSWARHLLHHSREFPLVLSYRRDRNTDEAHATFLAEHVEAERGHAEMLTRWLHEHSLVPHGEPPESKPPTPATIACIGQAYRLGVSGSNEEHIVGLNVALEAASHDFFSMVSPRLDSLGFGDDYWRVHVELDEFHSADGLAMLAPVEESTPAGQKLLGVARETILFWGFMLNSWVGVDEWPQL